MQETYDVEVDWRGFQLHPEIPPGGLDIAAYFGASRAAAMGARIESFAAEMGVELHAQKHLPSTIPPLAASEFARDAGALEPMRDRLRDAYWIESLDIESLDVIARCAEEVGLDGGEAAAAATDPRYVDRVAETRRRAHDDNVSAIPTLLVGGYPIVGCQRPEIYEMIAERRGLPRR